MSSQAQDERVVRHHLVDRVFHWCNALAAIVLLATGFLPVLGIKFPWLTIHWVAGVCVATLVCVHIVRALIWQDRWSMWVGMRDLRAAIQAVRWVLRLSPEPPPLPGKYPMLQKLFHHGLALVMLALIATGGLMLAKIDTPWWGRDPYFLTSSQWGIVYVVHGVCAMAVLAMVMVHIYFAVRPEKLWITRSMILGWITRREFADNHDSGEWQPAVADPSARPVRPTGEQSR